MSWKKYFNQVNQNTGGGFSPLSAANQGVSGSGPANSNYNSFLPDVYVGSPNRVERYGQYNVMDLDSEVNAALDILAEFCTQINKQNNTPFYIRFEGEATNSEVTITQKYLQQWCKLQEFETRMFRIMRNCFKYGDEVFVRDPETKKLFHVDPAHVTRIIVNESEGKIPEQYVIKNFNLNFKEMVATTPYETNGNVTGGGSGYLTGGVRGMVGQPNQSMAGSRFMTETNEIAIDAKHIVHLSMSEGLDNNYPFGSSLLETVFKVYKQKELLEDAIIIYRVQRAPERRVFYVDTGNMPSHLAMQFVERVKTQIHQRRIPSKTGGGQNVIDSSYNPISIQEDFYFPQNSEGRGSKVETLPAGCLSMDTQVSLLDGRELSINEIKNEMDSGKKLWTYSVNPETGEIAPGLISWAGVTQKSAKVMRLTLDNGNQITCTPDHKFPVYGKGFVRADELVKNQSMMPLHRKNEKISEYKKLDYEQFFDNYEKKWKYTHRVVADMLRDKEVKYYVYDESISDGKYDVRHHVDFNRYNNSPENLTFMSWHDCSKLHSDNSFSEDSQRKKIPTEIAYNSWMDFRKNNKFQNHVIADIEWLEEPIEVGTLTIDQDEIYHNYHTFALTAGIFTKNSNLGEIDDLRFFTNKLVRGLRIPSSYLPTGADDGNTQYNDGRVGTAYIQELRFNTYCERLQNMVIGCLDEEFKRYLLQKGVNLDINMFTLKFQPPQNFASYRQSEIDNARVPTYTQMSAIPYMSNRFALKRFLGMTDEEIAENERLWREENDEDYGAVPGAGSAEMRGAGITGAGIESDLGGLEDTGIEDMEAGDVGTEGTPPETATQANLGPVGSPAAENPPQG